ncbi:MAG: RNA-dependent DNA polymerase [Alcaligenaceae bacterium]|nr:RNA-dependent DNA polymerase [Alcaligenaceae bacterium]
MAKTFNNLFDQLIDFSTLYAAYLKARRGKRYSSSCIRFERDLEGNLIQLQNDLAWGSYKTGNYVRFSVFEPKRRQVSALGDFRDRVVHHAICLLLNPIYEPRFIFDSYACRVGKGTHLGADRTQEMMRECVAKHGKLYALKADISKYFASIDHAILKKLIRRKISDTKVLTLIDEIIDSYCEHGKPGKGLPLGNLTSQIFANIYLDSLDQFVKNEKRERWYVRYMDDFIILHPDKQHLQALRLDIQFWLGQNLILSTNHKTGVFPVSTNKGRGLDFLGYHLWPDRRRLRKASLKRFAKRIRRLQKMYARNEIQANQIKQQLSSWAAHAKHGHALPALQSILYKHPFRKNHGKSDRNTNANA